jgi:hypothetical protein
VIVPVLRCILFSSHYIDVPDGLITLDIETSGVPKKALPLSRWCGVATSSHKQRITQICDFGLHSFHDDRIPCFF